MLVLQALDEPELRRERMVQSEETYKNVLEIQVREPKSETAPTSTNRGANTQNAGPPVVIPSARPPRTSSLAFALTASGYRTGRTKTDVIA
jgi:hypothetical protein